MGRAANLLPYILILAGCAQPQRVEVRVPVEIPGPTRYVPVPADLLRCDVGADDPQTGGALLTSWQDRGRRLSECAARMREIEALSKSGNPLR